MYLSGYQLDIILEGSGYNRNVFINWLKDKELLKLQGHGNTINKKILGESKRVYAIKIIPQEDD